MQQTLQSRSGVSASELVEAIARYQGPRAGYLHALLGLQCRFGGATHAAIAKVVAGDQVDILAAHPSPPMGAVVPVWIAHAAQMMPRAAEAGQTLTIELPQAPEPGEPSGTLVVIPTRTSTPFRGVEAFVVPSTDANIVSDACERLELAVAILGLYALRDTADQRDADVQRLRQALETLAATDRHERFKAAAMAFVNEIATRWNAQRVSLGLLEGRYVHVKAISGTERVISSTALVQDIESAMEECADQDIEIFHPSQADAPAISREAAELAQRHGPVCVVSMPMRRGGEVVGVTLVERSADQPMSVDEVESLRLAVELCTARLVERHATDLWVGAKSVIVARRSLEWAMGPRHTLVKASAIAVLVGLLFVSIATTPDRVAAPFTTRALGRQVAPAPFDGYLLSVKTRPGDEVVAGETVLAELDAADLQLALAAERAEESSRQKEADAHRGGARIAEAQIALAQAAAARARADLLQSRINAAKVRAPLTGVVITGDLERLVGAPVREGDVLFEVAPSGSLGARLSVSESRVIDLAVGQRGELAAASYPQRRVGFKVDHIAKVAEVVDHRNVFHVDVTLDEVPTWLRPGMEGEARVEVGRTSYLRLWTRDLVNWIRMRLWL